MQFPGKVGKRKTGIVPHSDKKFYSIAELSESFREGHIKPSEITDFYLSNIAKKDSEIQSYQEVYIESATMASKEADKAMSLGQRLGPFHGIPFALKDIYDVQGKITTSGSKVFATKIAETSSTMAKRLLAAGGILLGKSKTVEFAFGGWGTNQNMGTPRNPWDKENHRICGGSSSGSAAALAADLAVCATGTDTGGSVRLPAAFCGVTGLKVTKNLLSTEGITPLSHTLDTPGPMTRSLLDLVVMFEVLKGTDGSEIDKKMRCKTGSFYDLIQGVSGLRIGAIDKNDRSRCSSQVLQQYDKTLGMLESQGAIIDEFSSPINYHDMSQKTGDIISIEAYSYHGHLCEDKNNPIDQNVRQRILKAKDFSAGQYLKLLEDKEANQKIFLDSISSLDALVTPTTTHEAALIKEVDQEISPGHFTRPFNYTNMCALSVPIGLGKNNLPVGFQIAARPNNEKITLRIGGEVERNVSSTL